MGQPHRIDTSSTGSPAGPETRPFFSQVVDARSGCIRLRGDLTHRTAAEVRGTVEALRCGGLVSVVVDLRGLRSSDDTGLACVEALRTSVEADGGGLRVLGPSRMAGAGRRSLTPRER